MRGWLLAATLALAGVLGVCNASGASSRASARSPSAIVNALLATGQWKTLPSGFHFSRLESDRPGNGIAGEVAIEMSGPYAGQGIGYTVATSVGGAALGFSALRKGNHAVLVKGDPTGTIGWTETDTGSSSACESSKLRCHETARSIQVGPAIVLVVVGSSKANDSTAVRGVEALLAFAIKRVQADAG